MNSYLNTIAGMVSTVASSLLGSKLFIFIGEVATVEEVLPSWIKYILGPLGALVGMIIAIKWLTSRLDKAEQKIEKREDERDNDRKLLMGLIEKTNSTLDKTNEKLTENTVVLTSAQKAIEACHAVRIVNQK
jgi:hypothetical protein